LRDCGTIYITGNEPCAADYVLFHELLDLDLINYKLDSSLYPHILKWRKACAGLRGNKEVYNLYATQVKDFKKALGYDKARQLGAAPRGTLFSRVCRAVTPGCLNSTDS
jgi:hypothetical protein